MGRAGKSTLATRVARKLEAAGFKPVPISGTKENPLSTARLLEACGDALLDLGQRGELATLRDPNLSERDRPRYIVSVPNRSRFVLALDNFEVNLDEDTRRIIGKDLAEFYTTLLNSFGAARAPSSPAATRPPTCPSCRRRFKKRRSKTSPRQVAESYRADRRQSLLRDAFGEG